MKRERETRSMQLMSGVPWETITLTTLSRDRNLFQDLLSEARDLAMRGQEGKLVIHTAWGTEWRPFGQPRRKRPLQSVVLQPGLGQKIENDVKSFLQRRQWYAERGSFRSCFDHIFFALTIIRYPIPPRVSFIWSARFWENIIHSGPGRFLVL
jgi:ATP-dependent Zn protease